MPSNPLPSVGRALARHPAVMRAAPVVAVIERVVRRSSRGRRGVLDLAGLPSMELTVLGRRTGQPRTVSLLYVPDGEGRCLLVGSNWGKPVHPAWSANLDAADHAEVHSDGQRFVVRVRRLTGSDRERAWARAVAYWPGYTMEQHRARERTFRIYELTRI